MSLALAENSWIGWGRETTWGTAVASSKFSYFTKEAIKFKTGKKSKPSLGVVSQNRNVPIKQDVSGSIEFQFNYTGLEMFLKDAIGSNADSGAGPYTHTMTCSRALPVGLTINVNRDAGSIGGSSEFVYAGCQVTKLTLKQSPEDFLMMTVDVIGQTEAFRAIETPTIPANLLADWSQFALTLGVVGGGSQVSYSPLDFEVTIENTLAKDRYKLGQLYRKGLGRGGVRKITGKFTIEFEDMTQYTNYNGSTAISAVASWTSGPTSLTITMNNLVLTGDTPNVSSAGPVKVAFAFEAYENSAEGDEISIVLVNSTATVA